MWNHGIGKVDKKEHDAYVRAIRAEKEAKRIAKILSENPHIGVLNGDKYYIMNDGFFVESNDPADLI